MSCVNRIAGSALFPTSAPPRTASAASARLSRALLKRSEVLWNLKGEVRSTFPAPASLLDAGAERLAQLRLGMGRHSKIIAAAERICDGRLDLERLSHPQVCYAEAKRRLMVCYGIGEKIADCIALFALDKTEAFPVDTWVEKAMAKYYPYSRQLSGEELVMWAQDRFGKYSGYANQLLFHELWHSRNRRPVGT